MTSWGVVVRVAIGAVGVLIVLGSLLLLPQAGPVALWGVVTGGALLVGGLFEVGRYRAGAPLRDGGRFERTDEVFVDPTTGVKTRVWFDAGSGERRYEPDR